MSTTTTATMPARVIPQGKPITISVSEILPWAIFVGFLMLFLMYMVGLDQGATSLFKGMFVHEWVHDARHLLGFPCH
ncbi:MAG: hypothetical protein JWM34_1119 [Ilumatobacteraceae bacterium]|nr:hypothetical protein [Ilumatobacteraceae bacterium]